MDVGGICASPFWNQSVSWNTKDPYFSECFKHLVLVIGSCAVLWIVAPLEFVKICRYHGTPSPWTKLSISKIICKILLLIICIIELAKEVYAYMTHAKNGLDGLIAAVAYFITIVLTVILTMMCKKRGLPSSLALPSFWMISTITTLISLYDDIHVLDWNDWVSSISLWDDSVVFIISLIQLILSSMSDKNFYRTGRSSLNYCPLEECTLPSRLTYCWLLKLFARSTVSSLHQDSLIPLCYELRSSTVSDKFDSIWNNNFSEDRAVTTQSNRTLLDNQEADFEEQTAIASNHERKRMSLVTALVKTSVKFFTISIILEIIFTALYFLPIYLLSLILHCSKEQLWHKYLYATSLFIALLLCNFADSQRKYYGLLAAMRSKTAVMNAVFEKALVSQKMEDIKDYLNEDAENIFQMVCLASEVWGAPIRLLIGLYILWFYLGSSSFIGFATAALLIPLNILVESSVIYFQRKSLEIQTKRMNVFKQILHDMKLLKIYAWEEFFIEKLMSLRKLEVTQLRKSMFIRISLKFFFLSSTSLVALSTFTVFVLTGNSVDVKIIFVSLYLIFLLKTPFTCLLRLLAYFVQGLASVSHIQKYLEAKEMESLPPTDANSGYRILLSNANFSWEDSGILCLKNLNLNIREGSLIAVIGESQSGKSSLLHAILGQMQKQTGTARVKGEIAFVGDTSWIQNTTVEKNILFLRPRVSFVYRKTLEACALLEDIDILPEGDETEIGEKGYNLNEDQKLKVDLARAVYQNADIYLLDNPLRSSDTSITEHLYQRVIGRSGILKEKTRIFTCSDGTFLPLVDCIFFLKDGSIVEQGSYLELLEKNGHLVDYLKNVTPAKKAKNKSYMKTDVSPMEHFKDNCDPWYSASELSLKPEVQCIMRCETGVTEKGLFRKLLQYIQINGYSMTIISFLAACIATCCEVASWMWWVQWSPDHTKGYKMHKNLYIYVGLILMQVFSTIICGVFIFTGATLAVRRLYSCLLNRIMRAPQSIFGPIFIEKVCQSFSNDLQHTDEKIPMVFYVWLMLLLKTPVLLIIIFINTPIVCVFSIPLMVAFIALLKLYLNAWRQLHHLTATTRCPLSNLIKEVLQGISTIRASNASIHFITRFHMKLDTHNNCSFLFLLVSRWLSSSIEIIGSFFVLLSTLTILVIKEEDSNFVGLVIVFALQIAESLIALTYMSSLLNIEMTNLERLQYFSTIKQEAEWENPSCELSSSWPAYGSITVKNLSTSYGETLYPALKNINMTVKPREMIAIVGEEESGIYTVLDSLFRIREISEGQIIIDDVDISSIGLHDLRSRLAFVPQDPLVFHGTLRQNLDPKQSHLDEEMDIVLNAVNLWFYFSDLNNIIEDEISLDVKRRISLARCLLKKPQIVILDEPGDSSAAVKNMFRNCTLLTFSESDVLDNYNRIIRISSGEVLDEVAPTPAATKH